jgi:hypothetical protein
MHEVRETTGYELLNKSGLFPRQAAFFLEGFPSRNFEYFAAIKAPRCIP